MMQHIEIDIQHRDGGALALLVIGLTESGEDVSK